MAPLAKKTAETIINRTTLQNLFIFTDSFPIKKDQKLRMNQHIFQSILTVFTGLKRTRGSDFLEYWSTGGVGSVP